MKVKRLIIKNIGMIADTTIELDKPLILFYGDIMQGKTTILNAVKFCFGGAYPTDIIRHGQEEASVMLEFEGGLICREWYRGKDDTVNARPIVFVRGGKPVKKPVDEIKKFLNPFLLDQDYLRKMTELERKNYFTQLFAVDTSEIDNEYSQIENEAKELRAKIKGYGDIDLTEVRLIDITPLKEKLASIKLAHNNAVGRINLKNKEIVQYNNEIFRREENARYIANEIAELEEKLALAKKGFADNQKWLKENPPKPEIPLPPMIDASAIEIQISEAMANEVRVEQYQKNLARDKEKQIDQKSLSQLEEHQRELKKAKIAKLTKINETCKIKNLSFDETGNFVYEGTTSGMLSGSQIMKLSSELSSLYPEGLGIDLIDRGESLGKSIFLFVDRAEREEKTILATIVGERPADVPENIGVFVVENGEVKP